MRRRGKMVRSANTKRDETTVVKFAKPIGIGLSFGIAVSLLLMTICAIVMAAKGMPDIGVIIFSIVATVFGGFISGFIASRLAGEKGLLLGLCCGLVILVIMMISSGLVVKQNFGIMAVVKGILVLLISVLGGILGVNYKRRRK